MDVKSKIKAFSSLRKFPLVNEKKMQLDALKLFNQLITFVQRDMTVETLYRFINKDHKMNKANKVVFSKTSLKALTDPLYLTNQPCSALVINGGWLLYMVKWEQHQTWQEMANLSYVQCLGRCSQKIIVVFDGYNRSPKDHDHIWRAKNSCCNLQIRPDMFNWTPRETLITRVSSSTFSVHTSEYMWSSVIMMLTLAAASDCSVEVRTICVCS